MDKKSNHQANIVRLSAPRVHTNAETLELFDIPNTGYQVVSKKGTFKEGELAIYIQPDSVVPASSPFLWLWKDHVGIDGLVPEKRRRITVKKLRGEYSEGLLMPLSDFYMEPNQTVASFKEGDDVSDALGITHYDPDKGRESTHADTANAPRVKRRRPKTLKGWFFFLMHKIGIRSKSGQSYAMDVPFEAPIYDVEAFKNFKNALKEGEDVIVTEKIHGSNARYVVVDGEFYCGNRTQWKKKGDNVWWKAADQDPRIEKYCRDFPGHILYGEVVPTQGSNFMYGCEPGEAKLYAFDVLTPEGLWMLPPMYYLRVVPTLKVGPFKEDVLKLADGPSLIKGKNQIREGVVIRAIDQKRYERGLERVQLKVVSNAFLEKDSR